MATRHDLWCSIPPSNNVFSNGTPVGTSLSVGTSPRRISSYEAEVADFELPVGIDQGVTRLEATMDDVGGVDVLETAKGLMNRRPEMNVGEWLLGSDLGGEHSVTQFSGGRSLGSIRLDHHDHIAGWGSQPSGELVPGTGGSPQTVRCFVEWLAYLKGCDTPFGVNL